MAGQNHDIDHQRGHEELKELFPFERTTSMERMRLSKLVRENIDVSMSEEEVNIIRAARQRRVKDLMHALRYAADPDDAPMMRNLIDAVKIGLPEGTDQSVIEETRVRLFRQSYAVMRGLDKNATQEEIEEAERTLSECQNLEIPKNACGVMNSSNQT